MSITQFKDALNAHLPDSSPVAVPLGEPIAVASTLSVERSDGVETGIWACTLAAGVDRSKPRSFATLSRAAAPSPLTTVKSSTYKPAMH